LDISRLEEDQTVEVTVEALPETTVAGTIRSIAPIATTESGVVTYDVWIDLASTDAPLRTDMTANATVVVEQLTAVLKIPTWVVRVDRDTGQPFVERRVGDEIERADVELGARHEGVVHVLSGVSEGDEIVRREESTTFDFGPPQ
jgi:multidrug efflux pump subunit AcrA (membrane-fusion protein)